MKITIVQGAFLPIPPFLGGAVEKMWYSLAKEFINQGHEVIYISKRYLGSVTFELDNGINHIRVKGYKTPSSLILLKILDLFYSIRILKKIPNNSDIIVSNTFWLPILLSSKNKRKCLIDVARIPKGQMKFYIKNAILRANSNVVSKAIKSEISSKFYEKVVMIPNTLPFKNIEKIDFELKQKIILYTGRIHPEKGIDILIESFKLLKNNDWQLLLVGPYSVESGGGGVNYLNYLKSKSIDSNIIFHEPIFNPGELNSIYLKSSIFVYPSIAEKGETFGVSPLEAMSCGCATIVSDLDCFKDFVLTDINGLIFDHRSKDKIQNLFNQLIKLIENPKLLNSLSSEAIKVNLSHSNETIANIFLDEFQKIISSNSLAE
jgi:glycosyltransferase involved in cell wall biosynthesis